MDYEIGIKGSNDDNYVKINCLINQANCFEQLKRYTEAVDIYGKAIMLNPSECYFYLRRGKLKILIDTKMSACLDLSKSGELGCEDAYEVIRDFCNN